MTTRAVSEIGFMLAMAAPSDGTVNPWVQFIPVALILGIFYFVILMPMKRKQKKVQEFLGALKVGDRVITTGGIYGSIVKLNERSVQLQIADKVRIEIARSAVGGYQGQEPVVTSEAANQ
jgi:preprotein translocase subunit YajC